MSRRWSPPAAPAPLTQDRFVELVLSSGIPLELAARCHRRRFPNGPSSAHLRDDERGRLWHEIQQTAGRLPLTH